MRLGTSIVVLVSVAGLFMAGCSCGGGSGGSDGVKNSTNNALSEASDLAKQVDGNFDKLTPLQKQTFLKDVGADEPQARQMIQMMAHPPSEAHQKKS